MALQIVVPNKKSGWFMDIKDKIVIPESFVFKDKTVFKKHMFCPPHRIPHTFPFLGSLVTREPCHFHRNPFRMFHHIMFCRYWAHCRHCRPMIRKYKDYQKKDCSFVHSWLTRLAEWVLLKGFCTITVR